MALLWIVVGLIVLVIGADVMVRGASGLAKAIGMSSLVIGLTVVSFGTSAPEMAVSVKSAIAGQADIALGNVIGSNTFNVLFILGVSAMIAPLIVSSQLIRLDVPIMIGVSVLVWLMAANGVLGRGEGILLFCMLIAYTTMLVILGKRESSRSAENAAENSEENDNTTPSPRSLRQVGLNTFFMVAGLGLLVLGSNWLVDGATTMARAMDVSELVIGLTIVAVGTSLPEVATSVIASIKGQRDIAVGNVVGSNLFNLLGVLGLAAICSPDGAGAAVEKWAISFDLPIMAAVAMACLPIFLTGGKISRWEGGVFLVYYLAYMVFTILTLQGHPSLHTFTAAMLWFVIPLTLLGLTVSLAAWVRRRRDKPLILHRRS